MVWGSHIHVIGYISKTKPLSLFLLQKKKTFVNNLERGRQ